MQEAALQCLMMRVSWNFSLKWGIRLTCEERSCWNGEYTSQKVSRPPVSTSCRRRIGSISANHVIDSCHVDRVVRNTNNSGEYHRGDPWKWRPGAGPGKADESDRQTWSCVQKPPE